MSDLDPTPTPSDLDLVGSTYHLAPYWLEEIVLLLRAGASDAEILAELQRPDPGPHTHAGPIPLTDGQCGELLAELKHVLARP
jgi:hypothetical protein